ncbi:MAG TPA: ankyrin repeat domain-containing protein [Ilumatobacteraceae bacterium]
MACTSEAWGRTSPIVGLLRAHGADPNVITRIDNFENPLETALAAGHDAVADRLRPLMVGLDWEHGSRSGDLDQLKRMARAGHDINAKDRHGQTALMNAARTDIVEWLVGKGAELDHTAKFHLSALMLAVITVNDRIARLLVDASADTSIRGSGAPGFHDKTAADFAEERGDRRLTEFLRTR